MIFFPFGCLVFEAAFIIFFFPPAYNTAKSNTYLCEEKENETWKYAPTQPKLCDIRIF